MAIGKRRILFISTTGAARVRMAAGLLAHFGGDRFAAFGAAPAPATPDALALRVLDEIGAAATAPIGTVATYRGQPFDLAITLCDGGADI